MLSNIYFQLSYASTIALIMLMSIFKNGALDSLDENKKKQYKWILLSALGIGGASFFLIRSAIGAVISVVVLTGIISIFEDEATKSVNRNMLRVGYLFTNIASYVIISNTPELIPYKLFLIVYFIAFLIVLLFFSGIGPSDARMFMLVCPLFVLLFKSDSLILLLITVMVCMSYQQYRQAVSIDSRAGVPMALPIYGTTFLSIVLYVLDLSITSQLII